MTALQWSTLSPPCTGDADVCALAGASFELAGETGEAQALTTTFRLAGINLDAYKQIPKDRIRQLLRQAQAGSEYDLPHDDGFIGTTFFQGGGQAITTRISGLNPTNPQDLTTAEILGRKQAYEYYRFYRDNVPGFQHSTLVAFSTQIGVREGRRVFGEYRLELSDVMEARKFSDVIAQSGSPVEEQGGLGVKWTHILNDGVYDIPLRCLIPRDLINVLVAGRCLSASYHAHASCRLLAQCMAMGEAAGTAAALCLEHGHNVRDLDVNKLQSVLIANGAILHDAQHCPGGGVGRLGH
ncbi:FAD-dependent oxidoreductase [Mesorhizobium yinganensis]|uniref:FAD-dependent oxidoreductase n=1 Tax=Mesorhizobium yinganensis TaxID=3157707 RepID=UPI0032B837E6